MEKILTDFILALRSCGVRVSVAESIDAVNTAGLVGYSDREILRDCLSAVLAKSLHEKDIFEECFDRFFSFSTFSEDVVDAFDSLGPHVMEGISSLARMILSGDTAGLATAMREAAGETGTSEIKFFSQKGLYTWRVLHQMGMDELKREIRRLFMEDTPSSREMGEKLEIGREYIFKNVQDFVDEQLILFSGSATEELVEDYLKNVKFSDLEQRDFHRMHTIIRKMVKRLNDIHSRRRKTFRRGQLDFMKTLRKNISYQGLLFDIKWKKKKVDRPDIVAICDVSRSVDAVSRFLLLFLCSLNKGLARIKTFIFCSNLVEVSHVFEEYPVEEAIEKLKSGKGLGIMLGSTDYGRAFSDFEEGWSGLITHKTSVLILGDARNNFGDPKTGIIRSFQERCKRLVWLNPESQSLWGIGDSEMKRYLPYCHLARECNTVKHLERVVNSLL